MGKVATLGMQLCVNSSEPASDHCDRNSSSEELAWLFACPKCSEHCRRGWRSVAGGSNLSVLTGRVSGSSLSQAKEKDALWVVERERGVDGGRWAGHSCQCNLTKTSNLPPAVLPHWKSLQALVFFSQPPRLPA